MLMPSTLSIMIESLNESEHLLDNCTYRAKVERYGTDAAKAVLASHDAALQLIKEIQVARHYGSGGWGSAAEQDAVVAAVTNQEKIDVLKGMVKFYDTHELVKGTHLTSEGACAEGAASCVMSERDDPNGVLGLSRMLGVITPGKWEIAANATIDWLRDELGPVYNMTKQEDPYVPGRFIWDVRDNNPLARFNDDPTTTKQVMVDFLNRKINDLECEIDLGHLGGSLGNKSFDELGDYDITDADLFTPEPSLAESE